jgi:hypothetical protein
MDSSPVTMMSTIHPLRGEDSLVLGMRKHPGNKSTNSSEANSTFLSKELQKELDIPGIVDGYNKHMVGVNVADQYRTYFDTEPIFRHNLNPLFNSILETALTNYLLICRDLTVSKVSSVDHCGLGLSIVRDLLQTGSPSTMKCSCCIQASQKITQSAPTTHSAFPPLPIKLVTKHTPLSHG